jgi:polysaccharide export outer membrane protein
MKLLVLLGCLVTMSLGGCSGLSGVGPSASEVGEQAQADGEILFDVVAVDDRVVSALRAQPAESFHARFKGSAEPPDIPIAPGDTLSITIWEGAGGGLFSDASPGASSTGLRSTTEPLAPESRPSTGERPGGFGTPNEANPLPPTSTAPRSGSRPPTSGPAGEAVSTEAFAAAGGGRSAIIPDQQVGADGAVSVPYAGRVPAAGRSPAQVQQTIEHLLAEKALSPQALVIVRKSTANAVTVAGEVIPGARIPLSPGGNRLLEVIAAAGGVGAPGAAAGGLPTLAAVAAAAGAPGGTAAASQASLDLAAGLEAPVHETFVRLSRDGVTATIPLARLVSDPSEDIFAQPGDVLTLLRIPQTFSVFGAAGRNALVSFDAEKLTLNEALGKSQGLRDDLANPSGVFLFRYEPYSIVRALDQPIATRAQNGRSPIAYRFDFKDGKSYLLAREFAVRDKDIIFVADAAGAQIQKLFAVLSTVTGPVITGLLACRSVNSC